MKYIWNSKKLLKKKIKKYESLFGLSFLQKQLLTIKPKYVNICKEKARKEKKLCRGIILKI